VNTVLKPRRPLKRDPENPLEDWLSGKLAVRHPDGRLRRGKTLWKYAWCVALLGHDKEFIIEALRERDSEPGYQKFIGRREYHYELIAAQVLRSHDAYARRQEAAS
jgi:hypothetical protein